MSMLTCMVHVVSIKSNSMHILYYPRVYLDHPCTIRKTSNVCQDIGLTSDVQICKLSNLHIPNDQICIFININDNIRNKRKIEQNLRVRACKINYISAACYPILPALVQI